MTVPDLTGLLFPTDLRLAWDGSATLAHDPDARLLPYLQPLLLPQPAPGTELEAWRRLHLSLDLDELLGDVAECGHVVLTQCLAPCNPPDCSPPTCLVEPLLPSPLPTLTLPPPAAPPSSSSPPSATSQVQGASSKGEGVGARGGVVAGVGVGVGGGEACGWRVREVPLAELARLDALGLQRRLAARDLAQGIGWRGFNTSQPYLPGGAVAGAGGPGSSSSSPPLGQVGGAEGGEWLQQLLSGELPPVAAPGLGKGLWGAWARPPSPPLGPGEGGEQQQQQQLASRAGLRPAAGAAVAPTLLPGLLGDPGIALGAPGRLGAGGVGGQGQGGAGGGGGGLKGVFEDLWLIEEVGEGQEGQGGEGGGQGVGGEGEQQEPAAAEAAPEASGSEGEGRLGGPDAAAAAAPALGCGGVEDDVDSILQAADAMMAAVQAASSKAPWHTTHPALGAPSLQPAPPLAASSHEWAVRGGVPDVAAAFDALRPRLALHFAFELDTFQKEAVVHLEQGHSVFVAAHTSAGKTAVAEYAFALATRHCTRAIYTSPIKTISNQKFRDLSAKFEVGLLTGDAQINSAAPCLIMTTEILRSMLYKGADLIRDVEWVVFDEVHYVNDAERGVVWEEVIIMLPPHIGLVLLSATVPNVMDFADWIGRTKRKVVYVTGTLKRPVPLQHSLYYAGELFTICSRETFSSEGVREANLLHKRRNEVPESKQEEKAQRPTGRGQGQAGPNQAGGRGGRGQAAAGRGGARGGSADKARQQVQGYGKAGGEGGGGGGGRAGERQQLLELVQLLTKKAMLPVAFFCFSKKRCDEAVNGLLSLDLTTREEKHTIHAFIDKCLARLKEADRQLPQILRLRELVRCGLAVHHAGLLPIMKEVVEMLFCQGYIKVLFCTETFAMGVNAPTRTVVFHSLRKHDGKGFRYLLPGEYTQMAGRAGRRGLDAVGHVLVACWQDIPGESELKTMLTGRGVSLESQFRLTYSMILNLMRVEDLKVEDMMKRSFAEFRAARSAPQALAALQAVSTALDRLAARPWPTCSAGCSRAEVEQYHALSKQVQDLNAALQPAVLSSRAASSLLTPGRLLLWSNPISGITEPAVYLGEVPPSCRPPTPPAAAAGLGGSSPLKLPGSGHTLGDSPGRQGGGGGGEGGGERRLALLALHRPGPVDARHLAQQAALRAELEPAPATKAKQPVQDEFAGMVMAAGKGGGKGGLGLGGGRGGKGGGPGPLPRYGACGGHDFMLADAGLAEVVGLGRGKIKVDAEEVLDGSWGEAGAGEQALSPSLRAALAAALRALAKEVEAAGGGRGTGADLPLLDPRIDLKVNDIDTLQGLAQRDSTAEKRATLRPHRCLALSEQLGVVRAESALRSRRDQLMHSLSDASLQALPEFELRVAVLQQLGYLDADNAVTLKGRVLCEINSTQDELVACELVFSGLLAGLSPAEAVALVSALVFQEKSDVEPQLTPDLAAARKQLTQLTRTTAQVQAAAGLALDPDEHCTAVLHCGLMQVVYEWAIGTPFVELCELTDVMEGSIVRAVVRLDQACRELQDAARVMGNTALFQQMQAASAAIKRDVVFAASLYVA